MLRRLIALPLLLLACSEARDDAALPADVPAADAPVAADVPHTDAGARTDAAALTDATPADAATSASPVVINEIRASGDDWVELYNPSGAAADLSGYGLADTDSDGGVARLSLAVRFPPGTSLAADGYLLVLANQSDAGVGLQTRCLSSGPSRCFHAGWSVSASNGETVWLVDARSAVVARGVYAPNAAPSGRAWGRLPNGTGDFAVTDPTPGARNAAP